MGWGEPLTARGDRAEAALKDALAAERERADRMAEMLRACYCYDPREVLAEHDADRRSQSA